MICALVPHSKLWSDLYHGADNADCKNKLHSGTVFPESGVTLITFQPKQLLFDVHVAEHCATCCATVVLGCMLNDV